MPDEPSERVGENEPPIRWRLRSDLDWCRPDEDTDAWTIKDPLRLNYFYLQNDEKSFLQLLDGQRGFSAILKELELTYPGTEFSTRNLQAFLMSAIQGRLVVSLDPGFGNYLANAESLNRSRRVFSKTLSLLTWRIRGIDPSWLFQSLHPWAGWIYRPLVLRALCVFSILAFAMLLIRSEQISREISFIQLLLSPQNVLWLIGAVVVVKVLHELGHGMTCHHFGGECHELGCLIIAFVPLLYCDVSDSWRQRRRYRMAVAAAGIVTELFIAALFGVLWLCSVPGIARTFFLNMVVVCSVNTVAVNANPLMRYDGYYIFCDLLRLPNLGQDARRSVERLFDRIVLGMPNVVSTGPSLLRTLGMTTYGLLSIAYRYFVTGALIWAVYEASRPYGLQAPAAILGGLTVLGVMIGSVQWIRRRYRLLSLGFGRRLRASLGVSLLLGAVVVLLVTPLPHRITLPFVVGPGNSMPVYVRNPGYSELLVKAGDAVVEGQTLVILRNPELDWELERTVGELEVAEARLTHLTDTRTRSGNTADAIPTARKLSAAARERLQILQQKRDDLTIRSPCSGIIIPPRNVLPEMDRKRNNSMWWGTPISELNAGVWLESQTLLCWVGTPAQARTECLVPEHEIELVGTSASADLMSDVFPEQTLRATAVTIGTSPELDPEREFIVRQLIALRPGRLHEPATTSFAVQLALANTDSGPALPFYSTGQATIDCLPMSLARRIRRAAYQTFAISE